MSTTRYTSQFTIEKTIGDGNCAFNAFVLALSQASVLDQIEELFKANKNDINKELDDFIFSGCAALGLPEEQKWDWAAFKNEMIRLRKDDPEQLQRWLAPIVRIISVRLARDNGIEYCDNTIDALLAANNEFTGATKTTLPDDVFLKHQCVRDFFDKAPTDDEIIDWWYHNGHIQFLDEMEKSGEWAGDIELKEFAQYLGVNLDIISIKRQERNGKVAEYNESLIHVYSVVHVTIPKADLNPAQINELRGRGVIMHAEGDAFPVSADPDTLGRLLAVSDVPAELEKVKAFIKSGSAVLPNDWSKDLYDQLLARNIVRPTENGYLINTVLTQAEMLKRIEAFENAELIDQVLMLSSDRQAPTITLSNMNALHYECAVPKAPVKAADLTQQTSSGKAQADVLEVSPSPPAPAKVFASAPVSFLANDTVDKIKKVLSADPQFKTWTVSDPRQDDDKVTYRSVSDGTKERFQIRDATMTTYNLEEDTFTAMLKAFRAAQPDGTLPKISTQNRVAQAKWERACQAVYGDKKVDWSLYITLSAPDKTPAPAPAPGPTS